MKNLRTKISVTTTLIVTGIFFISTVDARPHRGGGGKSFSRGGHASGGGFSNRSSSRARVKSRPSAQQRPAARPPAARPRPPAKRPGGGNTNINVDRNVNINNNWDSHHGRYGHYNSAGVFIAGAIVGGAIAAAATPNVTYITTLPCSVSPVFVSSINYYRCGSTWYQRGYSGDNVNYVIVNAPPGY